MTVFIQFSANIRNGDALAFTYTIIYTSGEQRISNYLLWQCAYTEFVFTDVLWPDFRKPEFRAALETYASRDRRYGKVK